MVKNTFRSLASFVAASAMILSLVGGTVAQAAALTSSQVSAIVSLLQSFGADASTIANVQASLTGQPTTAMTTSSSSYTFTSNLALGDTGAAVTALQTILVNDGDLVMPAGVAMGYFGQLTKTAVEKYQTANGISPVGSVGPLTRAALNAGSTVSMTPTTGSTSTTGTVTTGGSLSVGLAATSPVNSTLVSPSATALLAQYVFTGSGQVNTITLQRTGVSSDNTLENVYLYDGATRLTDAASVASGVISFNDPNGLFTVNGSMTLDVRADIASGYGGETVGVSLTSFTSSGAAQVNADVVGSVQNIAANANPALVQIGGGTNSNNVTASTVNAGTVNYNVWSVPVTVSTRSVYLDALTLKYIGSAPSSAFQNLALYVDGTKVGTGSIDGNDFALFDLTASPYTLTTGSHTIEVHADIVGGANYTGQFVLQNQADIMLADSQLQGVYVAAYMTGNPSATPSTAIFSQNTAGIISINAGSIVVNQDPTFNPTNVPGGSTGVAIAQYTLADYGEAVKVSQLEIQPSISGGAVSSGSDTSSLNNVTLYVNGAQVGSQQNWTGTALTFNLGSSLTVQAGQTVTLTVKADTINAEYYSYTAGNLSVTLSGTSNNAQGLTSNALSEVPGTAVTSNSVTLGVGTVTLAKNSAYSNQSILANVPGQEIGSFILQAGSNENVQLTNLTLALGGTLPLTSLSNLRTSLQTTPITAPSASNSFSVNNTINENTSQEIDVFADIGALASSTTLVKGSGTVTMSGTFDAPTTTPAISITANGQIFSYTVTATTTNEAFLAQQLVNTINASTTSTVSASLNNQSTSSVITITALTGGANSLASLTASAGTTGGTMTAATISTGSTSTSGSATVQVTLSATLRGMTSNTTITPTATVGQNITITTGSLGINSTPVSTSPTAQFVTGGSQFPVVIYSATSSVGNSTITEMDFTTGGTASAITSVTVGGVTAPVVAGVATVTGLNISVPVGYAGINIPVTVTYNTVGVNGLSTDNDASYLTLTGFKSQNGNSSIVTTTLSPQISSNTMQLVASKPTVSIATGQAGGLGNNQVQIAQITVSADAAGNINLDQLPLYIATSSGVTLQSANSLVVQVNGTAVSTATSTCPTNAGACTIGFPGGYQIPAGSSVEFTVLATPAGVSGASGTASLSTGLGAASLFKWTDIQGGSAEGGITGSDIANYPTGSYEITN